MLLGVPAALWRLTDDMLTIDFVERHRYPVLLVTSGRLGSINHTR